MDAELNEICEMFEKATPELLGKIARVLEEKGCKDVKEWMQSNPWYREFENGQKIEREFKRSNSIER